jgi:hypothetical protein
MAIYRFRVAFEDNEEIFREIEIKSTQNFEDFHSTILQSIGFDNIHNAAFYISDDLWRKGEEIVFHPLTEEEINQRKRKDLPAKKQMNKCKMASLIDDPHQKFVYVYDPKTSWTFLIELLKIVADDPKAVYPKCAKTVGEFPKQYKTDNVVVVEEDEDFDEEEPHTDDEAYVNAHSEDETALLEGEEGEEEVTESEEELHDDEINEEEDHSEPSFGDED